MHDPISAFLYTISSNLRQYRPRYYTNIGVISVYTRNLASPISGFSPTSAPICIRYVPDIENNIRIYRDRRQFSMTSAPICSQYQNIPISALHDIGANYPISGPPAPMPHRHWQPPPAGGRAGRLRATAQALQQAQPLDPRHARTF